MAKITREPQKIFGGSLSAPNNIAVFGSLKAGSPAYSSDPSTIQSAAYLLGWADAVVANQAPALQDMNALFYVLSYNLSYLMQTGVAEWDATTVYYIGSKAMDANGTIYQSVTDANTNNAFSDTTNWRVFISQQYATTSSSTLVAYDTDTQACTGTSAIALTIPQATSVTAGRKIAVKSLQTGAGVVTIAATGGSTIDGASSLALYPGNSCILISTGSAWVVVGGRTATGTYTPTVTNKTGVLSGGVATSFTAQYMQVGTVVTVSGKMTLQATAGGDGTFTLSLPLTTAFTAEEQCGGTIQLENGSSNGEGIKAIASGSTVKCSASFGTTGSISAFFSFTYQIL